MVERLRRDPLLRDVASETQDGGLLLNVKIDRMVREFTLDDEASALSKLVNRVDDAHQKIASQFSLDNDSSALARM